MRFVLSFIVVIAGCVVSLPIQDATISADLAAETSRAIVRMRAAPQPPPGPKPGDVCPNCKGKGYVGDGVVKTKCLPCDGTGKVQKVFKHPPAKVCTDGSCKL